MTILILSYKKQEITYGGVSVIKEIKAHHCIPINVTPLQWGFPLDLVEVKSYELISLFDILSYNTIQTSK